MKKLLLILTCFLLTFSIVYSYSLTQKESTVIGKIVQYIENLIEKKGEKYRTKYITMIEGFAEKQKQNDRTEAIIDAIIDGLQPKQEETPVVDETPTNQEISYKIVDTGVTTFYNNNSTISNPNEGDDFYGQDAQYEINTPSYTDNGDGTVTDNVTGLMWQQDMGEKMTYDEAEAYIKTMKLAGHDDWRIPTIKELYSLIDFTGKLSGGNSSKLYIDEDYFNQPLGDTSTGERDIDAQTWSSTKYVGVTMGRDATIFGVNFIDGRIKGYPEFDPRTRTEKKMYFRMVRGNTEYGKNNFVDNGDGTITDLATGLMWQQDDSQKGMDWEDALDYAENFNLAGYDDWKLPNAKELQSIVDYSRSPQTTNSPAIDPMFQTSSITDPNGKTNYPYFWTSTTHLDGKDPESSAVYIAFGEAQGQMHGQVLDVHGAGAQRSDPKSGNPSDYPQYFGPQGDVRYVFNYVRAVRNIYDN